MSEKRLDAKNRWRNVVVAFRMSPQEAEELNVKVALSGLSKQGYIIQSLLKHEVKVVGGVKVARKVQIHLETMLEELQFLEEEKMADTDFDELLVPLKHILTILMEDDSAG
ncbi:MAG: plasmid mobilization protein [Eubacterium sp.]